MKKMKLVLTIFLLQLTFNAYAQYQTNTSVMGSDYYLNPIFAGDYPDPSILRDGDNYYMVHSSFEYDSNRFQLVDNSLVLKAKGRSVGDCSPLLCIPSNHSYTVEVELLIEGHATGGLVLFYNKDYNSGILADGENIIANLRGWQFPTEKNVIKGHVFLRLKYVNNTVDMFFSTDGVKWTKIENSLEVSGMNHNVLSGFLSLRIGLCSIGDGSVKFKNFIYKPIQ